MVFVVVEWNTVSSRLWLDLFLASLRIIELWDCLERGISMARLLTSNTVRFNMWISADLLSEVQSIASEEGRNTSDLVRQLLAEYVRFWKGGKAFRGEEWFLNVRAKKNGLSNRK